ncbi:MAG: PIN domain-containing protein [Planctomycetes bacterium]|nr:PIN domain-containing protein [Planctomycetota bacterium]
MSTPEALLDTDVASFMIKGDTRARDFELRLKGHVLYLSFMSLAELYRWPRQRNWGEVRTKVFLEKLNRFTVLPYRDMVCWQWAAIMDAPGRPMPSADAWIAATALAYGLSLATHNRKDFEHIRGLNLIAP